MKDKSRKFCWLLHELVNGADKVVGCYGSEEWAATVAVKNSRWHYVEKREIDDHEVKR